MENTKALATEKISRLVWMYYWPAFVSVFINALYNIVDRIFIGQGVGSAALSGLTIVFPVMLIMAAFGMLFGVGTGVQISLRLGKRDYEGAERTLANGFLMMIIVSIFIVILILSTKEYLLRAFGANDETVGYATDYLNIILVGTLFQVVGFSLNNVIRSEGNAKIAMKSMLISALANLILDPIFIFGFGMGVKGAAIATVLSMFLMCVWVLMHFFRKKSVVKLHFKYMKPELKIIIAIVSIGMAPFSMQIAASGIQTILNAQLVQYGNDIAVAANGIIISISNLIIMSIIAVNMASQPIIGFNYGAQNYQRVKDTLVYSLKIATAISVFAFVFVQIFPGFIVHLFNTKDEVLYEIGVEGLRIVFSLIFLIGFQIVISNFFQSIGKAKISIFISMLRQVIVLVPLLLLLPVKFGLNGVWISMPLADSISAVIVIIFFRREWFRLNSKIALEK